MEDSMTDTDSRTQEWSPEIGKLAVHIFMSPSGHMEMQLEYRDTNDLSCRRSLLFLENFKARPRVGTHVDTVQTVMRVTDNGNAIWRRYATDEDLAAFFKLWSYPHSSPHSWIEEEIGLFPNLDPAEGERLKRISLQVASQRS